MMTTTATLLFALACSASVAFAQGTPAGATAQKPAAPDTKTPTATTGTAATAPSPAELPTTPAGPAATSAPPRLVQPEPQKKPDPKAVAEEQKRQLDERMDQVAERWRKRAAAEGWSTRPSQGAAPAK